MIRLICLVALTAGLIALPGLAADDKPDPGDGPIRLKKKTANRPDAEKPKATKEEPSDKPTPATEEDEKEALARLQRNLRSSEERLGKKDAGDATQDIQKDIVKDLDAFIERTRRQQQQQQNQQQSASSSSSDNQKPRPEQSTTQNTGQKNGPVQQPSPTPQPKPGTAEMGGMAGARPRGEPNRLADLYKDVWGHLPEALRLEIDAYSREKFMARYRDLLEQYYTTIAEKGRRTGD